MATYNVLDSIKQGYGFGQGIKANRLANALSGQLGQAGFDPSTNADFQQLMAIDPKRATAMQGTFSQLSKERKTAFFQDMRKIKDLAQAGEMGAAVKLLSDRHNDIKTLGGETDDTDLLIDTLNSGDMNKFNQLLDVADRAGVEEGFLASRGGMSLLDAAILETEQAKAAKYRAEVEKMKNPSPINPDFLKEERKVATDSVKTFNKRGGEVLSSFGKIDNILSGDGKLNRMKIASAMTSMARLLSPGIVTNQDFENLSNSANPASLLLDMLRGKGEEGVNIADELQRYGDPTNPDLFDKDAFLQTARQVAGAEIPTLIGGYEDAQKRARRAGVSDRARKTYFGENSTLTALKKMQSKASIIKHPVLGDISEDQIQEAMKNKNMTREQVLSELGG